MSLFGWWNDSDDVFDDDEDDIGNKCRLFFIREKNRLFYREEIECLLFCGHSLYFLKKGGFKR